MRSFGLVTTAAGLAAVAGFALVVKAAADFEHEMDAVQAVTGATKKEMDLLSETALDLSTKTVFSAGEIAGAMQALGKAGITVEEMMGGATQATINLAAAAGDELPGGVGRAAEVVANAMKTFDVGADQAEHFADVLVAAAASSTTSVEDLATSMRYAGPIAHELGLSIDDLATVLAVLGDRGIRGSTAGTSLRGVLLSLTPTSEKAKNAMKDLGLITEDGTNRFYDMHGALKPMPEVMQILGDATKGLSEQEKIAAFNAIFQRRAMNAALILAEQGAGGFDKYAAAIARLNASDIAAAKLDNLSGDMTILRNSIEALIIRAGQPFQEMLRKVVQALTGFVQKLNEVNPRILAFIAAAIGIAGVLLTILGASALFISMMFRMYKTFILLKEAIGLITAAFKLFTLSLLTNPLFLVVAAIAAIIGALILAYHRSEAFQEAWDRLFEDLRPIFEAIGRFVTNFVEQLKNLWDVFREGDDVAQGAAEVIDNMFGNTGNLVGVVRGLINGLIDLWHAAVQAFDYFADVILPTLIEVGYAIVNGIGTGISWLVDTGIPAIIDFGHTVEDVVASVVGWFQEHVMPVLTAFGQLVVAVVGLVNGFISTMWPIFQAVFANIVVVVQTAITIIKAVIEGFVNAVQILWNNFGMILVNAVIMVWNFIKGIIEGALRIIQGIIQVITGLITLNWSQVWEGIKNIASGVWQIIRTIVSTALTFIQLAIQAFLALIKSIWQLGWNGIKTAVTVVWALIKGIITAALNTIKGFIGAMLNTIKSIWNAAWGAVRGFVTTTWANIKNIVSAGISAVVGFLQSLPGRALSAAASLKDKLSTLAKNAMSAMASGITNGITRLIELARSIPGRLLSAIGDLGRLLWNAGASVVQGFIDGIKSKIGQVGNVLGGIKDKLTSWKGPPREDARVLINAGQLVMQGFIRGIKSQINPLRRTLEAITPDMAASASAQFGAGFGRGGGNTITIALNFPGITSAAEAREVERTLGNSDVLSKLIHATRAGVGAR